MEFWLLGSAGEEGEGVMLMAAQFMLNSCSRLNQVLKAVRIGKKSIARRVRGGIGGDLYHAKTASPTGISAGTVKLNVCELGSTPPLRCGQLP